MSKNWSDFEKTVAAQFHLPTGKVETMCNNERHPPVSILRICDNERLIILRALAMYVKDQILNNDAENAKDTADLIYTLLHEANIDG
jgi:hypothetical protein